MLSIIQFTLLAAATLSAALPAKPTILTEKDVIVFGSNGRMEIMKRDKYLIQARDLYASTPTSMGPLNSTSIIDIPGKSLSKRCNSQEVITQNPDSKFINWDVPMSSVVKATSEITTVTVTEGFSISNTVTVTANVGFTLVKDFLTSSFGISYAETWQKTSFSAAFAFKIPEGKFGAVVSNPATTRKSGHVDIGCVGVPGERVEYQADSFESKQFGGLGWVEGIISLCTGDEYPLKMCMGGGTLA